MTLTAFETQWVVDLITSLDCDNSYNIQRVKKHLVFKMNTLTHLLHLSKRETNSEKCCE